MKIISVGKECVEKIKAGVKKVSEIVGSTLGPRGLYVAYEEYGNVNVINDGVTIAEKIELSDPIENIAAKIVINIAKKTNDVVGDGTTTSVVLADAIISEGIRFTVEGGHNPILLQRGMEKTMQCVLQLLSDFSRNVESNTDISNVASISSHDTKIGAMIAEAVDKVGKDGVITVQEGKSMDTVLEVSKGIEIDRGYISRYMCNNDRNEFEAENALIFITDITLSSAEQIVPILEAYVTQPGRPLIIIAEDLKDAALSTLMINQIKQQWNVIAIKAPSFGESRRDMLEDLCTITGAEFCTKDKAFDIKKFDAKKFGQCSFVRVTATKTTIIAQPSDETIVSARKNNIRSLISGATSDYEKNRLLERIARLGGVAAVIKVGAPTETEMRSKKFQIEDALNATKAALSEGIVTGGGSVLVRIYSELNKIQNTENSIYSAMTKSERIGYDILKNSLTYPLRRISSNCGINEELVLQSVISEMKKNVDSGFDASTLTYVDMFEAGVIDPAKVTRISLQSALSGASLLLRAYSAIAERKDKPEKEDRMKGNSFF